MTKKYHLGGVPFLALQAIDFQLERCEMVAIVGASGSGKTTLMNIMGFLDRCTEGQYFFLGEEISHLTEKELASVRNQKIGFVFQSFFLLARRNVLQNVMLPLFYRGVSKKEAQERAIYFLHKVGMADFAYHQSNQLSGGQQQRVAIARALVGEPEVIFADEPTGSLDSEKSHELMNLLVELNQKEGRTIVIITHDREVSRICQRIVTIKDGKIME